MSEKVDELLRVIESLKEEDPGLAERASVMYEAMLEEKASDLTEETEDLTNIDLPDDLSVEYRNLRLKAANTYAVLGELLVSYEIQKKKLLERKERLQTKAQGVLENFLLSKGIEDISAYEVEITADGSDKIVFRRIEN